MILHLSFLVNADILEIALTIFAFCLSVLELIKAHELESIQRQVFTNNWLASFAKQDMQMALEVRIISV